MGEKKDSSLEFWYISNIFYYFSFCLRKNMKLACNTNGFWHLHSIRHNNAIYTEGVECGGDILKSIFTKVRVRGHLIVPKRTALFNIEELHGESRIVLVLHIPLWKRERNMLWRFSLVNRKCVCSCISCAYSYIFMFSPKGFANGVRNFTCFQSSNYRSSEPFTNPQAGEKTQALPQGPSASPSWDLGNVF